jgi:hypothetical protein
MENSLMDKCCEDILCAIMRFICGVIDYDTFCTAITHLNKSEFPKKYLTTAPQKRDLDEIIPWAERVFTDMKWIRDERGAILSSDDLNPHEAFIILLRAVKNEDRGLAAQIIGRYINELSSCRAVCIFLYNAASYTFKNVIAAQRFRQMVQSITYCKHENYLSNLPEITLDEFDKIVGRNDTTLGYRTLYQYGSILLEQKERQERRILDGSNRRAVGIDDHQATLYVLRRFNSFSPVLNYDSGVGGGYFLWTGNEGIAIDPGFDFIKNLLNAQIPIECVNNILVTHAHPDHLADVPSLVTLLFERSQERRLFAEERSQSAFNRRNTNAYKKIAKPKLNLYLGLSAYEYLSGIINLNSAIENISVHIAEPGLHYKIGNNIEMHITSAIHRDCIGTKYCIGALFKHIRTSNVLIYTSDTAIDEKLIYEYERLLKYVKAKSHVLLAHIGGVHEAEINGLIYFRRFINKKSMKMPGNEYKYPNHLGITGVSSLIYALKPKAVLIGEIGCEMMGMRADISSSLSKELGIPCLIADIGLYIRPFMTECKVLDGTLKGNWVNINQIRESEKSGMMSYSAK